MSEEGVISNLMKKGDYTVHVLIEEVRNIESVKKRSSNEKGKKNIEEPKTDSQPSPIVKITCFEESKRTQKPVEKSENIIIGEHFYFDKSNLTTEQLDSEKILIEVYDSDEVSGRSSDKSKYIGLYE